MELYCSNESQGKPIELCVVFDIKAAITLNITVSEFDLFLMVNEAELLSVEITKDLVGMKDRDYQRVLQHILNYAIANFNMVYSSSFSLDTANPLIPVAREFIDVTISPYIQNEFLFIGFAERPNVIRNHTQ